MEIKSKRAEKHSVSKPKKQPSPSDYSGFTDKKRKQKEADNHTVGGF